jgi:hypothetical protein
VRRARGRESANIAAHSAEQLAVDAAYDQLAVLDGNVSEVVLKFPLVVNEPDAVAA